MSGCSKHDCQREPRGHRLWLPLAGLLSLVWFVVRVVPRPSRAAYPCQQVAAPLAGGFVIWLLGIIGSLRIYRTMQELRRRSRLLLAGVCLVLLVAAGIFTVVATPGGLVLADQPVANDPIGEARGIHPGRVVWGHDPAATNWDGPGDGHWWQDEHTNQAVVDRMMGRLIRALSGETGDSEAWDALFRYCNRRRGRGDIGYTPGEEIAVKVNLVGCIGRQGGNVDPTTYDLVGRRDYMNTSPQIMLTLLRQLVHEAGVDPADIAIGDPLSLFPNEYHERLYDEFPTVSYLDALGRHGRTAVVPSASVEMHWSCHPENVAQDMVLSAFAEADYFINLANLKSHSAAGVTLCAKNYYGWIRSPPKAGHYDLHDSLARVLPETGSYRCMVDLMGHASSGGKALLYLIDGLYAGVHPDDEAPIRWDLPPFSGDWTSSLFASQDPVAIDSVGFDFLQEEGDPRQYPRMAAADDYLVEAALAGDPPSGTFYDPNHSGDVERLASLGVHEHWNDPIRKQYSRNLDPEHGRGIELVALSMTRKPRRCGGRRSADQ